MIEGAPAIEELEAAAGDLLAAAARGDRLERGALGRRERSRVSRRTGKYARHRLRPRGGDVAVDATLRAAAAGGGAPLTVRPEDLRGKLREHRSPLAVCLVVDNSYSLHADRLVETVKGMAFRLLEAAAASGDRVALVAFKGGVPEATVALPLTRSTTLARRRLEEVPLSGRTPLPDALARARRLLRQELRKRPNAHPVVVCLTDGLPTVPLRPGGDPVEDVLGEARALRRAGIGVVVVDACPPGGRGCGPALAEATGGTRVSLAELLERARRPALPGAASPGGP